MKTKPIVLICVIAFAAIAAVIFMRGQNDHKECNTVVTSVKNADGSIVTQTRHDCHERFSF